ncbi:hypothetical protein AAG906_008048 [Vitis piasezkii]
MTRDKSSFTSLENYDGGVVTFGDGIIPGCPKLDGVLYVEGLKANLLSISQMCDKDHKVNFHQDLFELWHRRFGHINYRDFVHLVNIEKVRGIPRLSGEPKPICGEYMKGRQTKSSHKKVKEIRTIRPLELLHIDLMGPMHTKSRGGKRVQQCGWMLTSFVNQKRKPNLKYFMNFGSECYILRDGENLGKFDAKSNLDLETTKENPNDILDRNIDPNNDEVVPLDDTPKEIKDKHRSKIPKNHPISNVIALRAWYERLTTYLLEKKFEIGGVDKTLFINRSNYELLVVQIYVDDIVFGVTSSGLALSFAKEMKTKFEMSMVSELSFFLGLQIRQLKDGIFISQSKYARELVKKFGLESSKHSRTPTGTTAKLSKDASRKDVEQKLYRSMIGSLVYLTASRPNISFSVRAYVRYQANPKESHLMFVKRIIHYINDTLDYGLWYPYEFLL